MDARLRRQLDATLRERSVRPLREVDLLLDRRQQRRHLFAAQVQEIGRHGREDYDRGDVCG
jgi:hypothetical protein